MNVLFLSQVEAPERWLPALQKLLPLDKFFTAENFDPASIDIALVGRPPAGSVAPLVNVKLVQSLWMGVDGLLADPTFPRDKPLARLIDPGMVAAMAESVVAHVLDYHRHHYFYRARKSEKKWQRLPQYMASDRTVGILGLGELGTTVAKKLMAFGFNVAGWKRRPGEVAGIEFFTGQAGMEAMLERSQVVICLLPLTPQTRGVLNAKAFSRMPKGASIVNVARGGHVVVPDLLAALASGQLAHAYLDVFDTEPLPVDSPLWSHPEVSITPHTAALTEPRTAIAKVAENIECVRTGRPVTNLVDFSSGY